MHNVQAKGILSATNGMNLYRGCSHGCIYCDSRSRCYHIEHDFEDIEVKQNALALLETALRRKRERCMLSTGAMTDPYIPLEKELCHMRGALELAWHYGFGFTMQTKSTLVLRDLDLIQKINERSKCVVQMTLTTADEALCKKLEPHVSTTAERFSALMTLKKAGIPTVVWLCPILPFINDTPENVGAIIDMCIAAGVKGIICFGMGLTLREGNREYYYQQLNRLFPGLKERYVRTYGNAYEVVSPHSGELMKMFNERCEKNGIMHDNDEIFAYLKALPADPPIRQLSLFDDPSAGKFTQIGE